MKRNETQFRQFVRIIMLAAVLIIPLSGAWSNGSSDRYADDTVVFRVGNTDTTDSKNPIISGWRAATSLYYSNTYEKLLGIGGDLSMSPWLAESYEISDDGLVWTFHLRKDVKWQDGVPFTADDVIYTYSNTAEWQSNQAGNLVGIKDYVKVDDYTVQFVCEGPKADMAMAMIFIVPEHIFSQYETYEDIQNFTNDECVGTGPFKLEEDVEEQYIKFVRNEDYWGKKPTIDELIYVYFSNADTVAQAFEAGDIDYFSVGAAQVDQVKNMPQAATNEYKSVKLREMGFNCWDDPKSKGNPLLLDKTIRVACEYAIDKARIVEYAKNGYASVGQMLLPDATGKWQAKLPADQYHTYQPEVAKKMLEDAGYIDRDGDGIRESADGAKLSFRFTVIEDGYKEMGLIIQENLKAVGIETEIEFVTGSRQSDIIYDEDFDTDMYIWGWTADYDDPSYMLSVITTDQIQHRSDCFYSNPYYDSLFVKQALTIDPQERLDIVHEMQIIEYNDAPYINLLYEVYVEAYNKDKWEGFVQWPDAGGSIFSSFNASSKLNIKPIAE